MVTDFNKMNKTIPVTEPFILSSSKKNGTKQNLKICSNQYRWYHSNLGFYFEKHSLLDVLNQKLKHGFGIFIKI
jgi:hypothetical protein